MQTVHNIHTTEFQHKYKQNTAASKNNTYAISSVLDLQGVIHILYILLFYLSHIAVYFLFYASSFKQTISEMSQIMDSISSITVQVTPSGVYEENTQCSLVLCIGVVDKINNYIYS